MLNRLRQWWESRHEDSFWKPVAIAGFLVFLLLELIRLVLTYLKEVP